MWLILSVGVEVHSIDHLVLTGCQEGISQRMVGNGLEAPDHVRGNIRLVRHRVEISDDLSIADFNNCYVALHSSVDDILVVVSDCSTHYAGLGVCVDPDGLGSLSHIPPTEHPVGSTRGDVHTILTVGRDIALNRD